MPGLSRFASKDMDVLVDAINKYSVGLDDTFTRLHAFGLNPQSSSYPPYNIQKLNDNEWKIELGLAGWSKEEVEVSTKEKQLHITSIKERPSEGNDEFLHRGLAARSFDRTFNLSEDTKNLDARLTTAVQNARDFLQIDIIIIYFSHLL